MRSFRDKFITNATERYDLLHDRDLALLRWMSTIIEVLKTTHSTPGFCM